MTETELQKEPEKCNPPFDFCRGLRVIGWILDSPELVAMIKKTQPPEPAGGGR